MFARFSVVDLGVIRGITAQIRCRINEGSPAYAPGAFGDRTSAHFLSLGCPEGSRSTRIGIEHQRNWLLEPAQLHLAKFTLFTWLRGSATHSLRSFALYSFRDNVDLDRVEISFETIR